VHTVLPTETKPPANQCDHAYPWRADQGDGTFRNPILYADYSDPDVVRVGDDYYLTASSFNCTPGLPILHSKDLVNWTIINHAIKNVPHPRYAAVQAGCGVWAPSIRFHAGKFWIFFPTPDEGIYVTTAEDPAGKWSDPRLLQAGKGLIDPCPLWDGDGRAYLVHAYANSRAGVRDRLRVCPMAFDASCLLGEGQIVFYHPEKHPTLEGPKFLKKDGWYYILAPAGGVERGWQVGLRAKEIFGPYEDKIVLHQGSTAINGPHQGALIDTADDGWWFIHFQDVGVYGRIVHLQPVHWRDGWPMMGNRGEPVLHYKKPSVVPAGKVCELQTSDEFDGPKLGLQWQWHANHRDEWYSLTARPGWLQLIPQPALPVLEQQPNLLLQKFPARNFNAETLVELSAASWGEEAGLAIAGDTHALFGLQHDGERNRVVLRTHGTQRIVSTIESNAVTLRVEVLEGGKCVFGFAENGNRVSVAETFQAKKGKWIGAKVGVYSLKRGEGAAAGHAGFDYFRFY
jgi:beta-xylosidase